MNCVLFSDSENCKHFLFIYLYFMYDLILNEYDGLSWTSAEYFCLHIQCTVKCRRYLSVSKEVLSSLDAYQ